MDADGNVVNTTHVVTPDGPAPWYGTLYDYLTGDPIGPATEAQAIASIKANDEGVIGIDNEGGVCAEDHYWQDGTRHKVRSVYVW